MYLNEKARSLNWSSNQEIQKKIKEKLINQSKFKAKIEITVVKNNWIKIQIAKNKEIKDFKNFKDIKDIKKQSESMNVFHAF